MFNHPLPLRGRRMDNFLSWCPVLAGARTSWQRGLSGMAWPVWRSAVAVFGLGVGALLRLPGILGGRPCISVQDSLGGVPGCGRGYSSSTTLIESEDTSINLLDMLVGTIVIILLSKPPSNLSIEPILLIRHLSGP